MKRLLFLLVLFLFSCTSQEKIVSIKDRYTVNTQKDRKIRYYFKDTQKYFEPFVGTWIYKDGDHTFVLEIWKDSKQYFKYKKERYFEDRLPAHYKLVQFYRTPEEKVIYTSRINIGNFITPWPTIIWSRGPIVPYEMYGTIYDVTGSVDPNYPMGVKGDLGMKINPDNPNTAQWKVTLPQGIRGMDQPSTFTIPTKVTLTKVN